MTVCDPAISLLIAYAISGLLPLSFSQVMTHVGASIGCGGRTSSVTPLARICRVSVKVRGSFPRIQAGTSSMTGSSDARPNIFNRLLMAVVRQIPEVSEPILARASTSIPGRGSPIGRNTIFRRIGSIGKNVPPGHVSANQPGQG